MSAREDRANRELRALEAAYRHGQLDRAGYRARRRAVFAALRARDEITARNAIVPATARRRPAGESGRDSASSILFAPRSPRLSRRLALALLAAVVALVLAVIWFASVDAHGY